MIDVELRTRAAAAEVYAAWADPARIAQWFVDEASGRATPGETLTWMWHTFGEAQYRVDVADAPARLVLSTEDPPEVLDITITRADGETLLRVVNSGFLAPDEIIGGIRSGWALALAVLREYLERAFGQPKRSFLHMRPARFEYADLLARYEAIATESELILPHGTRHPVRRIAHTDRELSVAFEAHRTVLELKAFATPAEHGFERTIAVRGITWDDDDHFTTLESAAARLIEEIGNTAPGT